MYRALPFELFLPATKRITSCFFEKFSRLEDHSKAGGAGLGLAICREVMAKLGGTIEYVPGLQGAAFRVSVPHELAVAAE